MFTVCVVNNMQWHNSFPIPERTGTNAQQMDGRNEGRWNLWHVVMRYMGWEMIKKLKVKSHQLSVDWSLKASNKFCCACREATSQTTGCDVIVMKRPKLYDSKKSFRTSINRTMSAWLVYRDSFRALPWSSAIYQNCLIAARLLAPEAYATLDLFRLSLCNFFPLLGELFIAFYMRGWRVSAWEPSHQFTSPTTAAANLSNFFSSKFLYPLLWFKDTPDKSLIHLAR